MEHIKYYDNKNNYIVLNFNKDYKYIEVCEYSPRKCIYDDNEKSFSTTKKRNINKVWEEIKTFAEKEKKDYWFFLDFLREKKLIF